MVKRIAVIGAGASGLSAIKCCLEEGLQPVCFERTGHIGGLWHYTEDVRVDQACVMKSTVINTSKEVMCFSDFPIPAENAVFMHNTKVMEYFHSYAQHFDLMEHIHFETEVVHIEQAEDFTETGQWMVSSRRRSQGSLEDQKIEKDVFDGVMICSGHHASKYVPQFPGADSFKGRVLHTQEYKHCRGLEDLRVLIVGVGNSASDAAVELSKVASKVYVSTRRGTWVVSKLGDNGLPTDLAVSTRFGLAMSKWMGPQKLNDMIEKGLNQKFDHQLYGLKPAHRFTAQHPMVSDEFPYRIACGCIDIKPNVKEIREGGVEFVDGSEVDVDVILYATGYVIGFPFLDKKIVEIRDNTVELYKYVFPPDLAHPSLAMIGLVQPLGSTISMAEMQSRWVARVFAGTCTLPDADTMWGEILRKQSAMAARYVTSRRHTIQVDWVPYMDELAEMIGCKPNIKQLALTDPRLAWQMYFGPCTPLHYRLTGPGRWCGARQTILETWDRVYKPFKGTRTTPPKKTKAWIYAILTVIVAIVIRMWLF